MNWLNWNHQQLYSSDESSTHWNHQLTQVGDHLNHFVGFFVNIKWFSWVNWSPLTSVHIMNADPLGQAAINDLHRCLISNFPIGRLWGLQMVMLFYHWRNKWGFRSSVADLVQPATIFRKGWVSKHLFSRAMDSNVLNGDSIDRHLYKSCISHLSISRNQVDLGEICPVVINWSLMSASIRIR